MSAIGTSVTLQDLAKRLDPNGKIDKIAEVLTQQNDILLDMLWVEGNLPTGHKTTIRAGLPTATWRLLNYGVQPTKSVTTQVTDSCGMLENYAEVDKALADLNGNTSEFRLSEDKAFLEGMNQQLAGTIFYGNTEVNPERFVGLGPRFDLSTAANGTNIIKAGGSGSDNTSIWLVVWGDDKVHGIYPKGSKVGLQHNDLGEVTLTDSASGRYQGYRTHYKWDCGLTVRDWRYVVRICNIDISNLETASDSSDSSANILKFMSMAIDKVPNLNGRPAFYMNNRVMSMLRVKLLDKSNVWLTLGEYMGKRQVLQFQGVPCRRCDQILNTESVIN